ncbi:MAG: hypothetical protein R3250_18130, partial [Melioribacteraceae bacterium]|nr:hypothetical protein [Melioribacteraceae bacterium]
TVGRTLLNDNASAPLDSGLSSLKLVFSLIFKKNYIPWLLFFLGIPISAFVVKPRRKLLILFFFLLLSFFSVVPTYRFYYHYWLLFIPALSIFAAMPFHFLEKALQEKRKLIVMFVFSAIVLFGFFQNWDFYFKYSDFQKSHVIYGDNMFYEIEALAKEIESQVKPEDEVFVLGSEPQFYYYLDKVSRRKHLYLGHLQEPIERNSLFRSELTNSLKLSPPHYVLLVDHPFSWSIRENSVLDLYQWSKQFIKTKYIPLMSYEIQGTSVEFKSHLSESDYIPGTQKYVILFKLGDG